MNQDIFGKGNDCNMGEELEYFDSILRQHTDCNDAQSSHQSIQQVDSSQLGMEACISGTINGIEQIPKHNVGPNLDPLLEKLCNKNVNLVLIATSLDESEVVKKLKSTLDPEKSSMIPLNFENNTNSILGKDCAHRSSESNAEVGNVSSESRGESRNKSKEGKDERYRKRRNSNNEAAKKSRNGRKVRFEWIESRIKELEVENASLREQLDSLTKEVLEKEGLKKKDEIGMSSVGQCGNDCM